jgi:hypothetical protein
VRLSVEPAKNFSFWTRKADIVKVYKNASDFWLPAHNHTLTTIWLAGHVELTIGYKD